LAIENESDLAQAEKNLLELLRAKTGHALDRERFQRLLPELTRLNSLGDWAGIEALLAVGKTSLFRDEDWFRALDDVVIPSLARRHGAMAIWSAGCSTGEELASLAALVSRWPGDHEFLGTDLIEGRLEQARGGFFSSGPVPEDFRRSALRAEEGGWRLSGDLSRRMNWRLQNLVVDEAPRPARGRWSVISCRNVLIYLEPSQRRRVLERLCSVLDEDGVLVTAPAETLLEYRDLFEVKFVGEAFFFGRA
jgi:chemotaxis protein methyltransferase CheR